MIENFLTMLQQVVSLFLLIAIGAVCYKTKILGEAAVKSCTNLVLYIATPCIILTSCIREFSMKMLSGFLVMGATSVITHALLIGLAHLLFRERDEDRRRVLRASLVFSNAGYMALPLQQAILGEDGVFYCAAYIIIFNVILWTYGLVNMSGNPKELSLKKVVTNPGLIGVSLGLIVFLLMIPFPFIDDLIPQWIRGVLTHMGNLNTPLPMLIVGYYLAQSDLRAALRDWRSHLCIFLRLIAIPLVMLGVLLLAGVRGDVLIAAMICISTPVATAVTMFATRYDRNPRLSVNLVSVSTLLSILTMPLIVGLAGYLDSIL